MAKIITKAVTRLQKFLAAIAGDAVAPTPITNQEKLLFNIAEEMKAASASDLPDIGSSDKNKYLHTNESTGALEWAEGSSGGGVLVVHDVDGTLDKTWQEIKDADFAVVKILTENGYVSGCVTNVGKFNTSYDVQAFEWGQDPQTLEPVASVKTYRASSADGYPVYVNE